MIRLLVNDEACVATGAVTRFGGLPLIPMDSGFQWPYCSSCKGPLLFLGQIALDENDAESVVLLFMCENQPGLCEEWDANSGGNRAVIVVIDGSCKLANPPALGVAVRDTAYGVRVEVVDSISYDDARHQWADENNHGTLSQILGQIGGQPSWLQGDETPTCDNCGGKMNFVAQLEEGPHGETAMNFGGGGCAYVFRCRCGQPSAKFLWQCG